MTGPSRRSFLLAVGAAGVGAAGVAAAPADAAAPAAATAALPAAHPEAQQQLAGVLVRVRDASKGELGILVGQREVILHDPSVVAAVLSAIA